MYSDEPKCPKKASKNHCVDCYGYWCSEKGSRCEICESFWCPDWQHVFAHSINCGHKTDEEYEDNEIVGCLEEGVCPICFLKNPALHCSNPSCELNYNRFLMMWLKFCTEPISLGSYKFEKENDKKEEIEIFIRRLPRDGEIEELWKPNRQIFFCKHEGFELAFETAEHAVEYARKTIETRKQAGKTPHKSEYTANFGHGILSETRVIPKKTKSRDSSPKRKET
jgi:hypothetical protein